MDLLGGIIWVAGVVASVALSILANLLTPRVENWWARRSKTSAQKRAQALEQQLQTLTRLYQAPVDHLALLGADILRVIIAAALFAISVVIYLSLSVAVRSGSATWVETFLLVCYVALLFASLGFMLRHGFQSIDRELRLVEFETDYRPKTEALIVELRQVAGASSAPAPPSSPQAGVPVEPSAPAPQQVQHQAGESESDSPSL